MEPDAARRAELAHEADRIAEDADITGRQHLAAGQYWRTWATRLGLPATLLATATSAGAGLSALLGAESWIIAGLAFIGALAAAVRLFFRADEQASAHSAKGARYISLRDDARRFERLDTASSLSLDALSDRAQQLGARLNSLRELEPRETPPGHYAKVKAEREAGNYEHRVDRVG